MKLLRAKRWVRRTQHGVRLAKTIVYLWKFKIYVKRVKRS